MLLKWWKFLQYNEFIQQMLRTIRDLLFPKLPPPSQNQPVDSSTSVSSKKDDYKMIRWSDGTVYLGASDGQQMVGRGRLIFPNGQYYEGQFQNNNFQGQGIYCSQDGVYDGNWQNGLKNGYGKQKTRDGASFVGKYENGFKQGFGIFQWPDGSFYQGMFKKDGLHGPGKMTHADGSILEGQWCDNQINGMGTSRDSQGNVYLGFLKNGIKHGSGVLMEKNRKIQGFWVNGYLTGVALFVQNETCISINSLDGTFTQVTDCQFQELRDRQNRNC